MRRYTTRLRYFTLLLVCCSATWLVVAQTSDSDSTLLAELKGKANSEGWKIAEWQNRGATGYLNLFPFSAAPRTKLELNRKYNTGWVQPGGRLLLTWENGQLFRYDLESQNESAGPVTDAGVVFGALSADGRRVAVSLVRSLSRPGTDGSRLKHVFYIGDWIEGNGMRSLVESDSLLTSRTVSWDRDGRNLVVGIGGRVTIYGGSTSNERRVVAEGSEPMWSPDGRSISFLTPSKDAAIYDTVTGITRTIMPGRKPLARLEWSPDSKYLLFSEKSFSPPCASTRVAVLRVADGITSTVLEQCLGWTNEALGWIIVPRRQ